MTKILPKKLNHGDHIALIAPAGAIYETEALTIAIESLEALGLRVVVGKNLQKNRGYLAGTDQERLQDLHQAFADPQIKAVIAMRGGWGCARLLPHIDFDLIRKNPKILAGFSDLTSLLTAVYAKTGLVTFHSPMGSSVWNEFTVTHFKNILFDSKTYVIKNPITKGDNLAQTANRTKTIRAGMAQGELVGGNLAVLTSIVGCPYLPAWEGKILFLEEVNEEIYRVDRMLCQLQLAGVLRQVKGIVLGQFTNCGHGSRFLSLTLEQVFDDYFLPLDIPVFSGLLFGHINQKFTLPIGMHVEMNATEGTIELLESLPI
jgi:muramoyltetrapeptide carboxypeptidase